MTKRPWKIGDLVWKPLILRGYTWKWSPARVVAIRKDKVVVTSHGWETEVDATSLAKRRLGRPTGQPRVAPETIDQAFGRTRWAGERS